jgi:hypothetical protein
MSEFAVQLRHMCRNLKCRMKLPAPVSNEREAFCCRGCYRAFYRKRCLVCEQPMERKTEHQKLCGKRKCRSAFRAGAALGRYLPSSAASTAPKTPDFIDSKQPPKPDRGIEWAIAVNSSRIRAPRHVLDAVFGRVPFRAVQL